MIFNKLRIFEGQTGRTLAVVTGKKSRRLDFIVEKMFEIKAQVNCEVMHLKFYEVSERGEIVYKTGYFKFTSKTDYEFELGGPRCAKF